MAPDPRKGQTGFQPPTRDQERRAFFDLIREIERLRAIIEDHETRITALEP